MLSSEFIFGRTSVSQTITNMAAVKEVGMFLLRETSRQRQYRRRWDSMWMEQFSVVVLSCLLLAFPSMGTHELFCTTSPDGCLWYCTVSCRGYASKTFQKQNYRLNEHNRWTKGLASVTHRVYLLWSTDQQERQVCEHRKVFDSQSKKHKFTIVNTSPCGVTFKQHIKSWPVSLSPHPKCV